MNTLTAIVASILLATAISYNAASTSNDSVSPIGPPETYSGDTIEPGGPPPTYDGGDTPVCLSCD